MGKILDKLIGIDPRPEPGNPNQPVNQIGPKPEKA